MVKNLAVAILAALLLAPMPVNKRGVGYTWDGCETPLAPEVLTALNVSWLHAWWPVEIGITPYNDHIETVSMIWGEQWLINGCPELAGNSEWLLGFNEPDIIGQSDLTPQRGAELWHQVEECFPHKRLVSPATAIDLDWLASMRSAYINTYGYPPRFDALGVHCYSTTDVVEKCRHHLGIMKQWLREWNISGGIWINEWAPQFPPEEISKTIHQTQRTMLMFDRDPDVTRYAMWVLSYGETDVWYIPQHVESRLWDCKRGEPTPLGRIYAQPPFRQTFLPMIVK